MIIIVFFIVILLGSGMFLLTLGKSSTQSTQDEYMNIYATNLLTTLVNTDIDEKGSDCEKMSDLIYNTIIRSTCKCSDGNSCSEWLDKKMGMYFSETYNSFKKENLDYHLEADYGGSPLVLHDNPAVKEAGKKRWTAEVNIFKTGGMLSVLNINLIIAQS